MALGKVYTLELVPLKNQRLELLLDYMRDEKPHCVIFTCDFNCRSQQCSGVSSGGLATLGTLSKRARSRARGGQQEDFQSNGIEVDSV